MSIYKHGGIKKVEYVTAGNSFSGATDLGVPLEDSEGITEEPQNVATGKGTQLYAGVNKSFSFNIPDFTNFSDLETKMEADTEIDVRVTYLDDSTENIAMAIVPLVNYNRNMATGSRNYFVFTGQGFET